MPGMKLVAMCLLAPALQVAAQPGDVPVEWSLSPDAHGVTTVSLKPPLARCCCTGSRGSQPRRALRPFCAAPADSGWWCCVTGERRRHGGVRVE